MTTATKNLEGLSSRLTIRTQAAGLLTALGAVIALVSIIYSSVQLRRMDAAITLKRAELHNIEARTAKALRALQQAQSVAQHERELLVTFTSHAAQRKPVSLDLLNDARESITSSEQISRVVAEELQPAVGIVIAEEDQRKDAEGIRSQLIARGFRVKYILSLGSRGVAPEQTEVRHFKALNEPRQGPELVKILRDEFGVRDAVLDFDIDPTTPPNDFEIWLSKKAFKV